MKLKEHEANKAKERIIIHFSYIQTTLLTIELQRKEENQKNR